MSTTAATTTKDHASRLHAAYLALTFKSDPSDPQDARREGLFKRLVLHRLLENVVYTRADWHDVSKQQQCTFDFLNDHAKALWPGELANRSHLARPPMRKGRSFVGGIDGFWSGRDGGSKKKINARIRPGDRDLDTPEGRRWLSKIGKAFCKFVDVLLEPALADARVEDPGRLVAGIVSVRVGPEILTAEVEELGSKVIGEGQGGGEVPVKAEDESD
jgi:hypothetical protein